MRKKIYLFSGFTLIELLVAMGIVAFLGTASVAILGNFNRRQNINIAYDDVRNVLAQAKSYALSQVVSSSCDVKNPDKNFRDELIGYRVGFNTSTTPDSYSVYEVCNDPSGIRKSIPAIKQYSLPSEVNFGSVPAEVVFKVLTGGAESSSNIAITTSDGQTKSISVSTNGVIR